MGDSEEIIEYSPEELEEIDRILNTLPEQPMSLSKTVAVPPPEPVPAQEEAPLPQDTETYDEAPDEEPSATPEEMLEESLKLSELDTEEAEDTAEISANDIFSEDLSDEAQVSEEIPEEIFPEDTDTEEIALPEDTAAEAEEVVDITDFIHDVEEPVEETPVDEMLDDVLSDDLPEPEDEISEEQTLDFEDLEPAEITDAIEAAPEEPLELDVADIGDFEEPESEEQQIEEPDIDEDIGDLTPLEELDAISREDEAVKDIEMPAADEPGESLEIDDSISGDDLLEELETEGTIDQGELEEPGITDDLLSEIPSDESDVPDIPDIPADDGIADQDIPDMPDIPDIPDMDVDDLTPMEEISGSEEPDTTGDELPGLDIGEIQGAETIDEPSGIDESEITPPSESPIDELAEDPDMMDDLGGIDSPEDDSEPSEPAPQLEEVYTSEPDDTIDLSDKELKKLKKSLLLFNEGLRNEITQLILNDVLSPNDTRSLVDMILNGKKEEEIKKFVESQTGKKVETIKEKTEPKRKVISARPEYTTEGRKRQKKLLKATGFIGIAALIIIILTILINVLIYKPWKAKQLIDKGVAKIRETGEPITEKMEDYKIAEDIFRDVEENYVKNYSYGYNQYANAYFDQKEYEYSLDKLNKAYKNDKTNIDTLNNLGDFYSRVPNNEYERIKKKVPGYYKELKPKESQLDLAIDFYRIALNLDKKNLTAFYGIGNAYFNKNQTGKAEEYYKRIITNDKDSVEGYSGLLNLYIEKNSFKHVLDTHLKLKYREMVSEVPSALLGKLAAYYLSKKRTDLYNIRIEEGILEKQIKDFADNPYPIVKSVIKSMSEKDSDYAPLYLHSAKLNKELKNLSLMERDLKSALLKVDKENYFGALHLLGEYHYILKEPKEAYIYFNRALNAQISEPVFTKEIFYKETESTGKTYSMLGNIFYYFFDKVTFRFGDELESRELTEETEKFDNYEIARDKYEKALKHGYKSPELFYNLGRIYYMRGQYEKSADLWQNLYEDFTTRPELILALGNTYYNMNKFESSKGQYLKLISVFEHKAENIQKVFPERSDHLKTFQTLSSAYNNLGAIYQIQNNETKSNICYWKSVNYLSRLDRENEFARINLARAFKPGRRGVAPVIDKNIPYSIDIYREDMR